MRPKKQVKKKERERKTETPPEGGLELSEGFLPKNPTPGDAPGLSHGVASGFQLRLPQTPANIDHGINSVTPSITAVSASTQMAADSRRPVENPPYPADYAVFNQLSSITAPARRDSDSESSSLSDEELEEQSDPNGSVRSDGTARTNGSHNSGFTPSACTQVPTHADGVGYFNDAVHYLSHTAVEDEFWTQYGGLE